MANEMGPSAVRQESGKSRRGSTNLFGKGQRVITDKYRKGYDAINWKTPKEPEKLGFKIVKRNVGMASYVSEIDCMECARNCASCW